MSTSAPDEAGKASLECPLSTTTYTVPRTNLTFQRQCGIDYAGSGLLQTTASANGDMGKIPLSTMEDCLAVCAQLNLYNPSMYGPCIGVSWSNARPQGEGNSYCWLKNKTTTSNQNANVESAILLS